MDQPARPRIITFDAVSADGFTEGFEVDQETFYGIVAKSREDVTLSGSNTILAAGGEADPEEPWRGRPAGEGPIHAVIDSRGRVRSWDWLRAQPHWRDTVVIGSKATPAEVARDGRDAGCVFSSRRYQTRRGSAG